MKRIDTKNKLWILYLPFVMFIVMIGCSFIPGIGMITENSKTYMSLYNALFAGGKIMIEKNGEISIITYTGGFSWLGLLSVVLAIISFVSYIFVIKDSFQNEVADVKVTKVASILMILSGIIMIFYNKSGTDIIYYGSEKVNMSYETFFQGFDFFSGGLIWIIGSIVSGCISFYLVTIDDLRHDNEFLKDFVFENRDAIEELMEEKEKHQQEIN